MIIAYEAADCIERLLDRIPSTIGGTAPQLLISDDASGDATAKVATAWLDANPTLEGEVVSQPTNLGYGGNQKYCFERVIGSGADVAVLLHGDEQYPPELIDDLVAPIADARADVVYGSRTMTAGAARAGGMPLNRFLGNRFLSRVFNALAGTDFTEWFSGYRAYSVPALAELDLDSFPDGFDFDVAITIELTARGRTIVEVPMPTHYGDELSRVPLLRTGRADLGHVFGYWRARRR